MSESSVSVKEVELHEGMGVAVAERTILRPKYKNTPPAKLVLNPRDPTQQKWYQLAVGSDVPVEYDDSVEFIGRTPVRDVDFVYETWGDVAERVSEGNVSLVHLPPEESQLERNALRDAIKSGTVLMSGRHMQHGDKYQSQRPMMVFTNCATAANSFSQFYLLLNGCFAAGTEVKMADDSYRPIEKVLPGEKVYSYDENTKEYVVQKVLKLNTNQPKPMVRVKFDNGNTIDCTDDHKFLVKCGKWVQARDLTWYRTKSMTSDETRLVVKVEPLDEKQLAVYDLTVENTHNYLVGPDNIVVHNSGVGRSYDDDMMLVDWDYAPNVQCVISEEHTDYPWGGQFLSTREAKHRFNGGPKVHWFVVPDTREGWAQAIEYVEGMAYQKIYHDHLVVLDFSNVRPQGSPIKGMQGRVSSGPIPLMSAIHKMLTIKGAGMDKWKQAMFVDHYAAECVLVGGARRSARMATKYWKDKSIFDFIQVKRPIEYIGLEVDEIREFRNTRTEQGLYPLQSFLWSSNNSVMVDREFWDLVNLKRGQDGYSSELARHARKVFQLVTECSYGDGTGEPGFINVDLLTDKNDNFDEVYSSPEPYIKSNMYNVHEDTEMYLRALINRMKKKKYKMIVNPCVSGDCQVPVSFDGGKTSNHMAMVDLVNAYEKGHSLSVLSYNEAAKQQEWKMVEWAGETRQNAELVELSFDDGCTLKCTPDHKIFTTNRGNVEAKELTENDHVVTTVV